MSIHSSKVTAQQALLSEITALVRDDFEQANALINQSLHSDVTLIKTILQHIVQNGGKRLRPLVTLLAARAVNTQNDKYIALAVIVEFLHTATLLHDDVVDLSTLRRGQKTANILWGNSASVLVGDFLYSRAFQLMTRLEDLSAYALLADATNTIAQGEVLQLARNYDINLSETHYLEVISYKTATLFSAACHCSALVSGSSVNEQNALAEYGMRLGLAFQMIDDWMDYAVSSEEMGKNMGDDLSEGKVTLPIIYAMQKGSAEQQALLKRAVMEKDSSLKAQVVDVLYQTQTDIYILNRAQQEIERAKAALALLPESAYKKALFTLTEVAIYRTC